MIAVPSEGRERAPVRGIHVGEAGHDHEQDHAELERDDHRVGARALADADHEQRRDREDHEQRRQVHERALGGARRVRDRSREVDSHAVRGSRGNSRTSRSRPPRRRRRTRGSGPSRSPRRRSRRASRRRSCRRCPRSGSASRTRRSRGPRARRRAPATANDATTPGPAWSTAATPVSTKMPVPMIPPMPSITRSIGPSTRLSACAAGAPFGLREEALERLALQQPTGHRLSPLLASGPAGAGRLAGGTRAGRTVAARAPRRGRAAVREAAAARAPRIPRPQAGKPGDRCRSRRA